MSELPTLSDDLLYGAGAIAEFMFGKQNRRKNRRKVYGLVAAKLLPPFPAFHMGKIICGRKSSIKSWVTACERAVQTAAE
jgi:hypothetical protein